MVTKENTLSVTELRQNTAEILRRLDRSGPFYVFRHSEPEAVILDIDHFNALSEVYEDFLDAQELLSVAEREIKAALPWKEFKKKRRIS